MSEGTNLGKLNVVIPPTDERFSARQGHWYRIENNELAEHLLSGMTSPDVATRRHPTAGAAVVEMPSQIAMLAASSVVIGVSGIVVGEMLRRVVHRGRQGAGVGAVVVVSGAVIVLADVGDVDDVVEMLDVPPRSLRLSTGRNRHPQPRARRRSLPILDRRDSVQNGRSVGLRLDLSTW